jgi:hypothetical protein
MTRRRSLIVIFGMILGLSGIFLSLTPAWGRGHDDAGNLSEQIQRERNPVKKAKLEIRLARLELQQMVEAYNHNQVGQGKRFLGAYLQEVTNSWSMLKNSGRNAAKNPSGFMQLEIALRENARVLHDLHDRLIYLEQNPIEKALGALNQLHSQVLLALFPGAAAPGATARKSAKPAANSFASKELHP